MTISDYARKHARTAREDGPLSALADAGAEAALSALTPLANAYATPVWTVDWDVCLVLDACRLDLWGEVVGDEFAHTSAWSVGSASPEWMANTFAPEYDQQVAETAYVTANPFSGKDGAESSYLNDRTFPLADRGFAHLDEAWRDGWPTSDGLPTVDPSTLTDRAMWAADNTAAERTIVHYMQPHIPFKKRPEWCDGWDIQGFGVGGGRADKDAWHRVRDGELPADEFWNAYAANLEWVLKEVRRWVETTDGRVLITSDHGNAMGELRQWSHPPGSANPALRRVPFVLVDGDGDREREYGCEPPTASEADDDVEARLAALGYR